MFCNRIFFVRLDFPLEVLQKSTLRSPMRARDNIKNERHGAKSDAKGCRNTQQQSIFEKGSQKGESVNGGQKGESVNISLDHLETV